MSRHPLVILLSLLFMQPLAAIAGANATEDCTTLANSQLFSLDSRVLSIPVVELQPSGLTFSAMLEQAEASTARPNAGFFFELAAIEAIDGNQPCRAIYEEATGILTLQNLFFTTVLNEEFENLVFTMNLQLEEVNSMLQFEVLNVTVALPGLPLPFDLLN